MSHLVPQQEEKSTANQWKGRLPVDHEMPPQSQSTNTTSEGAAFLVPPQQEKRRDPNVNEAPLYKVYHSGVERLEKKIHAHAFVDDPDTSSDAAQRRQMAAAVLSGSAGVTGEDLGIAEDKKLV
ncbi:uncharacterized protein LAESUDRAFT_414438 [Laetiporus sulphureus 93-53]|uniref:Uncharacterized protein n=1 Tax=Laetiporus sulphureus 93-53 TaxID=1314785 RepID=A0A165C7Z0_9APHY|nr:uncharacterized protein LAESUDRAFT_414438 [Laetiporus sulphureus 93-53]KZT02360.1 hypothetical protein LAESUDRAFT_414438 [Laetiporus sulphureus 93-53]